MCLCACACCSLFLVLKLGLVWVVWWWREEACRHRHRRRRQQVYFMLQGQQTRHPVAIASLCLLSAPFSPSHSHPHSCLRTSSVLQKGSAYARHLCSKSHDNNDNQMSDWSVCACDQMVRERERERNKGAAKQKQGGEEGENEARTSTKHAQPEVCSNTHTRTRSEQTSRVRRIRQMVSAAASVGRKSNDFLLHSSCIADSLAAALCFWLLRYLFYSIALLSSSDSVKSPVNPLSW